jgi:hypothetical protein
MIWARKEASGKMKNPEFDRYEFSGMEVGACKSIRFFVLPRVAHEDVLHLGCEFARAYSP